MLDDDLIPSLPLLAAEALRQSLGHACLDDLPWLDHSHRRESGEPSATGLLSVVELRELSRLERLDLVPRGHGAVAWVCREKRHGLWWRPHRLDEVFVEAFFPWWNDAVDCRPPYVAVISSGPYGGIETVYVNGRRIYQLPPDMHPDLHQKWKADLCARNPRLLDCREAAASYGVVAASSVANSWRILRETKS